jgi:hypothetical protein
MALLRRLNNRLTFNLGMARENVSIPVVAPLHFTWHKFFQESKGRVAGKIGGSELLALEYFFRWFRPPFPAPMSWCRPAKRVYFESGVFPLEKAQFEKFLVTYQNAVSALDAVKLWQRDPFLRGFEERLVRRLCPQVIHLGTGLMNYPSVVDLADLNWLVVSPFVRSMKLQADRMQDIHPAQNDKAKFVGFEKRCQFLQCPPYSHLQPSPYHSWSEGLERMTEKALKTKYDLAVVGAGAWSLPLLANLKKEGRNGIHLGGETQLLFGIKGKRWDSHGIYNKTWIRPDARETPEGKDRLEHGCYW